MDIRTKAVNATINDTSASADEYPGTFVVELSNETLDRDGDTLKADEWELPLPEQITFVNDHTHKMSSVVGSAKPELVDGKIICRGTWAETSNAQETRKVIKHVPYVSVAYREKRDRKAGTVTRELINGSFVVIPANPTAKVLASKSFGEGDGELDEATTQLVERVVKKALQTAGVTYPEAQPNSVLPQGFTALTVKDDQTGCETLIIKDSDGKSVVEYKLPAPDSTGSAADLSADREKGLDLSVLKARAMLITTGHEID